MRYLVLVATCLVLFNSCKSSKNLSIVEEHRGEVFVMPNLKSTLNLHYRLNKQSLKDTFNVIIDQYLAGDMKLSAMEMDVKVNKVDEAIMEFSERRVLTRLPLEINVSKNSIFKEIKATGTLDLNFVTEMDIDSSWNLVTKTTLEHYEWIKEPNLSLGVFTIPVGKLANGIIDKSKTQLETQIDRSVNEQLSVRDKVLELVKHLEEPIQVDTLLNSWVTLIPEYVHMSEIVNTERWTEGNVTLQGKTRISDQKPQYIGSLNLPEFYWQNELDKNSHINFVLDIGFQRVNDYLNANYKGREFSADDKSITLNSIHFSSRGDRLLTVANVSGSVNGDIYISGKPIFDNDKQAFYADDIDIELKTKNVFHKAGAWLLKGKVKNQLKELLSFSVKENVASVQEQIDLQVQKYSVKDQLDLKAEIQQLNINKFVLDDNKIHAFVTLNLFLEATIHDMRVFNVGPDIPEYRR